MIASRAMTLAELIKTALERYPGRIAFVHDGRSLSYAHAANLVRRMVGIFAGRGLTKGDGFAVLSANRPEAWLASAAAMMLGCRYTPLHPLASIHDLRRICEDADVHTLVFDPAAVEVQAAELAQTVPFTNVFSLCRSAFAPDLDDLVSNAAPAALAPTVAPSDVAQVMYTGGTTGQPKGVSLSHRACSTQVQTVLAEFQLPACPRYLAASPITHASGLMILPTLLRGGTVFLHDGFDPERLLDTIARERINACFGVPTMIYLLLDHPALARRQRDAGEADQARRRAFMG